MASPGAKKTRSSKEDDAKWTDNERDLLAELACENLDVLRSKKTTSSSLREKAAVWDDISKKFHNQPFTTPKTINQLKKGWENLNNRARRKVVNAKHTGEQISSNTQGNNWVSRIYAHLEGPIIPPANPYDSDCNHHQNQEDGNETKPQLRIGTPDNICEQVEVAANVLNSEGPQFPSQVPGATPMVAMPEVKRPKHAFLTIKEKEHDIHIKILEKKNRKLDLECQHLEKELRRNTELADLRKRKLELEVAKLEHESLSWSQANPNKF